MVRRAARRRLRGRVLGCWFLVSSWERDGGASSSREPGPGLTWLGRGWVPDFSGTTDELGPSAVLRTGSVRAELAVVVRSPPRPWVPASAGTTGVLSGFPSACAGATGESPSPQPSPVEGEGEESPSSLRSAVEGEGEESPSSPRWSVSRVEGEGVWESCSSRSMCTRSSLAAAIRW